MKKGFFVTFEGIEGCGKSTQAYNLYRYLSEKGTDAVLTHEPGATHPGKQIRDILLNAVNLTPICELFLFMADRSQHIEEIIRPSLDRGAVVICDRFHHSTFAYQAGGRHVDEDIIKKLNSLAVGNTFPDLTFLIDVPPEIGMGRKEAAHLSLDRIEKEEIDFHNSVREAYRRLAYSDDKIVIIDGTGQKEDIRLEILEVFKKTAGL